MGIGKAKEGNLGNLWALFFSKQQEKVSLYCRSAPAGCDGAAPTSFLKAHSRRADGPADALLNGKSEWEESLTNSVQKFHLNCEPRQNHYLSPIRFTWISRAHY